VEINSNLLEVKNLTKIFYVGSIFRRQELIAVDNVSFSIPLERPLIFGIIGESGSGKTTVARLILGFIKKTSGEIFFKGKNIEKFKGKELKNYYREVQAIFQDPFGAFNMLHSVDRVLKTPIKKFNLAHSNNEAMELISKSLEAVGLNAENVLGKYPDQLSGGERQRVMLARAFLIKPKLIVADEPTSMLDASLKADILNIIKDFKEKSLISFIYISHNISEVYYVSDMLMTMYLGSQVEIGITKEVVKEPLHPYTRMLMDSVPVANPEQKWREKIMLPAIEVKQRIKLARACKFYDRCPKRMNICHTKIPALIDISKDHKVACFLYS